MAKFNTMRFSVFALILSACALNAQNRPSQTDPALDRPRTADKSARIDVDVDVDKDKDKTRTKDREAYGKHDRTSSHHITKASDLIGMEVKNNEGERLGTIKDMALDLRTGRISYAVLASGGVLGIGEKLVAVPMAAFKHTGSESFLVLNADQKRLEASPGIDRNNWPNMPNEAWGADVEVDVNHSAPKAIEKRDANSPTVNDLKREAQDRQRELERKNRTPNP